MYEIAIWIKDTAKLHPIEGDSASSKSHETILNWNCFGSSTFRTWPAGVPFVTQQLSVFTVSAFRRWSNGEEAERKQWTERGYSMEHATLRRITPSRADSLPRSLASERFALLLLPSSYELSSTTATVDQKKGCTVLSRVPLLPPTDGNLLTLAV